MNKINTVETSPWGEDMPAWAKLPGISYLYALAKSRHQQHMMIEVMENIGRPADETSASRAGHSVVSIALSNQS